MQICRCRNRPKRLNACHAIPPSLLPEPRRPERHSLHYTSVDDLVRLHQLLSGHMVKDRQNQLVATALSDPPFTRRCLIMHARVCVCVRACVHGSMLKDNHHEASFFATPPLPGLPPLPHRVVICWQGACSAQLVFGTLKARFCKLNKTCSFSVSSKPARLAAQGWTCESPNPSCTQVHRQSSQA